MDEEKKRKIKIIVNKAFFIMDGAISVTCAICSFAFIPNGCLTSFFLYYSLFYLIQAMQHYLLTKLGSIDVVKYDPLIKKAIFIIAALLISYLFLGIMFWQKTNIHPMYCALCEQWSLPLIIGMAIDIHFIIALFWFISLIQMYISRKYYLIAIGGFEVETRINRQRQQSLRRMPLIEPDNYFIPASLYKNQNKYFKFEDIAQDIEGEEICSICLTKQKEGIKPVITNCKHYFHRQCIQNWVKINSTCPQCRTEITAIPQFDKTNQL